MSTEHAVTEDRGPAVFAVTTATLALATTFVAARIFCRKFIVQNISWDDRIIVLAWCIAFGLSFTIDFGVHKGIGRHDVDIPASDMNALRRCEYVFSVLYNPALMATKTSILIFYLRLAKNTQRILRLASWVTLAIVNVAGTVLTFMNIFQCDPIHAAWSPWLNESSKCIPLLTEFICAAPVNIVTDLAILALPIPVLTGMRLPPRQKTILVLTFSLGFFVTIVDVVRIYYLQQAIVSVPTGISNDPKAKFGQTEFSWNASLSLMWSAVEVNVGMTCACIPTLKPLIIKILPAMIIDPDGSGTSGTKDTSVRDSLAVNGVSGHTVDSGRSLRVPSAIHGASHGRSHHQHHHHRNSRTWAGSDFRHSHNFRNSHHPRHSRDITFYPDLDSRPSTPEGHEHEHGNGLERDRAETMPSLTISARSRQENAVYFGFVNMAKPKSMLRCSVSESWRYCTAVTVLFFLWGVTYGLLNSLNNAVSFVTGMSWTQTLGLTSAYFGGGYLFGPLLVGEWILRRDEHHRSKRKKKKDGEGIGGFKVTFIVGLCFYGIGTIIFWPSAVTNSFGGFMLSNFVVGFGLSILETGANAFLILCGPEEYADTRLMLAQGVQAIGSVLAVLLAQKVFFNSLEVSLEGMTSMTLINVQWTYLAITLACVILALFFYYMPLPEVSDSELDAASRRLPVDPQRPSVGGLQLRTWGLILAVVAQWTYMAAQEGNNIFFRQLLLSTIPGMTSADVLRAGPFEGQGRPDELSISNSDYLLVAMSAFALSRFIVAYILYAGLTHPKFPKPRMVLGMCVFLSTALALITVVVRPSDPNLAAIPIVCLYFTEGPCWPLIFSMGLRGQGRRTKRAAAFITIGGSGPGFFPFVMYAIIHRGATVRTAFIVVMVLQLITGVYPLYLAFVSGAKNMVDPVIGGHRSGSTSTDDGGGSAGGSGSGEASSGPSGADEEEGSAVADAIRERRKSLRKQLRGPSAREKVSGYLGRAAKRVSGSGSGSDGDGCPGTGDVKIELAEDPSGPRALPSIATPGDEVEKSATG